MIQHLKTLSLLSYVVAGTGILWLFYCICNGIASGMMLNDPSLYHQWTGQYIPQKDLQMNAIGGIVSGVCFSIGTLAGIVVNFMAAAKFKKAESRNFLIAVSILNVIPCLASCCLIGIPVGIYSLMVLFNAPVKNLFAVADPSERQRLLAGGGEAAVSDDNDDDNA